MTAAGHHINAAVAVGRQHCALKYAGCVRISRTWERQAARTTVAMERAPQAGVSQCEYDRALDRRHTGLDASGVIGL